VGKVRSSARVTQSLTNLRQIGLALHLYVPDNKGFIPGTQCDDNDGVVGGNLLYWHVALNPYIGASKQGSNSDISSYFVCPVYRALIGVDPLNYKGGYAMNSCMAFVNGGYTYNADQGGIRQRYSKFLYPARTVFVSFGVDERFDPNNDGTRPDEAFYKASSGSNLTLVPHNRRIGAGSDGKGGTSAGYLFLDGSVRTLTPDEAKNIMKRVY
jgi:prepilin-type processing-associated H-X9-DG protein